MMLATGSRPVSCPTEGATNISSGPVPAESGWIPAGRYSDQPTGAGTRLLGTFGVGAVASLILGGALLTWQTYAAPKAPATLSVFNVAPPATPPEPVREVPPGPEREKKIDTPQPDPDVREIEPPVIQLPGTQPPPAIAPTPVQDPGPPAKETTAPAAKPAPPAPQVSAARPTWEGLVLAALNKAKRYPREASFRRQQGVPYIRFVLNREGRVLSARLERSCGFKALDDEAVSLPARAQPLPKLPADMPGDTIELVVPVEFFLR